MAIAAAAIPALAGQLTPEQVERQVRAMEQIAKEARGAGREILHQLALTEDEDFRGWIPIAILAYRGYQVLEDSFIVKALRGQAQVSTPIGTVTF